MKVNFHLKVSYEIFKTWSQRLLYEHLDEKDERDNRWKPEIICEQIDMIFDYFESDEDYEKLKM